MYAVLSIIASDRPSLSLCLPSSPKARIRFLSVEVCACLLKSYVLNLFIVECMDASMFWPRESLLLFPITVLSPISCFAKDTGEPVLALSLFSDPKFRHSGRFSVAFSENTRPQSLHTSSPDSGSAIWRPFLHTEHTIETGIYYNE